jgi:hypothetical protein
VVQHRLQDFLARHAMLVTVQRGGLQVTVSEGYVLITHREGPYSACHVRVTMGVAVPLGGDSGGPAFVSTSGGVNAAGTIVSFEGNTWHLKDAWWEQYSGNLTVLTS